MASELDTRRKMLGDLDELFIEMETGELKKFWAWMLENQYSENTPWQDLSEIESK